MSVVQVFWATAVVLEKYMSLENQVGTLVSATTALQNTVAAELGKVRDENTAFKAGVVEKAVNSTDNTIVLFSGTSGKAIKNGTGTTINEFGAGTFDGVFIGVGTAGRDPTNCILGSSQSLSANTTGRYNAVIGKQCLNKNTTGSYNIAIGYQCLRENTTGQWNIAGGINTLFHNTTGDLNIAFGVNSLFNNTTGSRNVAIGYHSLRENTVGIWNVASGNNSLSSNTVGNYNSAFGANSLIKNISGEWNSAFGANTLFENTLGTDNTAIGKYALYGNVSGNNNTAVGASALASSSTSNLSNCSALGSGTEVSGSNQVQLGNSLTTTYVFGTVQNRSDERDKADIQPTALGLEFIKALRPVDYRWDMRDFYRTPMPAEVAADASDEQKSIYATSLRDWQENNKYSNLVHNGTKKKKRIHHGLIAQDVAELIKKTGRDFGGFQDHKVSGGEDVLSIGYDELIAPLIKAVQELDQDNEELRGRIATLEARK